MLPAPDEPSLSRLHLFISELVDVALFEHIPSVA
jgi:hypothetical protein